MKVLVTGSTGLVGSALCDFLTQTGHEVIRLVRRKPRRENEVRWSVRRGYVDTETLDALKIEAVVHLAGENIFGLWSDEKKARIRNSRVQGTKLLSETLTQLKYPPHTFICASAIGYYGNRGDEILSETSAPGCQTDRQSRKPPFFLCNPDWGADFLSETCAEWERATEPALNAGIRVINLRIAPVLSTKGGALAKMLPAFRLGVAGPLGSGQQYMSWIDIDDLVGIVRYALEHEDIAGPVNAAAPNPVTNKEFTRKLSRRAFFIPGMGSMANFIPAPAFGIKLALGEMGNALLLSSTRVEPVRLIESGYRFVYPELDKSLKHLLS